jgi:hypothetical protein
MIILCKVKLKRGGGVEDVNGSSLITDIKHSPGRDEENHEKHVTTTGGSGYLQNSQTRSCWAKQFARSVGLLFMMKANS